jgi:hypothetical protein
MPAVPIEFRGSARPADCTTASALLAAARLC